MGNSGCKLSIRTVGCSDPCSAEVVLDSGAVKNTNPITLLVHAGSRFHRKLDEALANVNCGRSFPLLTFPSVGNKLFQPSTLQRSAISVFSLQTPHRSQVQRNSTRSTATTQQENKKPKQNGLMLVPHALGEIQLSSVLNFLTPLP